MRTVTLSVEVSADKARDDKFNIPADTQTRKRADGTLVYVLTGPCVMAEPSDFESPEATQALSDRLAGDLGEIKRGDTDTGSEAGGAKDLVYVLNNGGTRLAYNKLIIDKVRPAGGSGAAGNAKFVKATQWAVLNGKLDLLTADPTGKQAIAAWEAAGSPLPK